MAKYIDVNALERKCANKAYPITVTADEEKYGSNGLSVGDICRVIDDLPAADVEPVRHGSWEGEGDGYSDYEIVLDVWHCSLCGYCIDDGTDDPDLLPNYCPNCGGKMDGGSEE